MHWHDKKASLNSNQRRQNPKRSPFFNSISINEHDLVNYSFPLLIKTPHTNISHVSLHSNDSYKGPKRNLLPHHPAVHTYTNTIIPSKFTKTPFLPFSSSVLCCAEFFPSYFLTAHTFLIISNLTENFDRKKKKKLKKNRREESKKKRVCYNITLLTESTHAPPRWRSKRCRFLNRKSSYRSDSQFSRETFFNF